MADVAKVNIYMTAPSISTANSNTVTLWEGTSSDLNAASLKAGGFIICSDIVTGVNTVTLSSPYTLQNGKYYFITVKTTLALKQTQSFYTVGASGWYSQGVGAWAEGGSSAMSAHLLDSGDSILLELGTLSGGSYELYGARNVGTVGYVYAAHTIAHDPSPADAATDIAWDLSGLTNDEYLSWENGSQPDTYDVFFGTTSGSLVQLITGYTGEDATHGKWFCPYVQLLAIDEVSNLVIPNGYRPVQAGDTLTNQTTGATYAVYRVEKGHLVNVHYQYYIYATRIGEKGSDGEILTNGTAPDADNPQAVKVVMDDRFLSGEDSELAYLPHIDTTYYWRIDSVWASPADTQPGDEWSFTTKELKYFRTYELVSAGDGGSGNGPSEGGVEGADWYVPNSNVLVAAAANAIWYEDKI